MSDDSISSSSASCSEYSDEVEALENVKHYVDSRFSMIINALLYRCDVLVSDITRNSVPLTLPVFDLEELSKVVSHIQIPLVLEDRHLTSQGLCIRSIRDLITNINIQFQTIKKLNRANFPVYVTKSWILNESQKIESMKKELDIIEYKLSFLLEVLNRMHAGCSIHTCNDAERKHFLEQTYQLAK